jgi:hypothetical protein
VLVWPDLVTGVGLIEPIRVEDAHAGQGLARQLLDTGLRGLTAPGCTRLKVSFETGEHCRCPALHRRRVCGIRTRPHLAVHASRSGLSPSQTQRVTESAGLPECPTFDRTALNRPGVSGDSGKAGAVHLPKVFKFGCR